MIGLRKNGDWSDENYNIEDDIKNTISPSTNDGFLEFLQTQKSYLKDSRLMSNQLLKTKPVPFLLMPWAEYGATELILITQLSRIHVFIAA